MSLTNNIKKVLEEIAADNVSGSATLQRKLEEGLLSALKEGGEGGQVSEQRKVIDMFLNFREEMSSFAVLGHFTDHLVYRLRTPGKGMVEKILDAILDYRKQWSDIDERIYRNFLSSVPGMDQPGIFSFLLHSHSGTICEFFRMLTKEFPTGEMVLMQTESRPALEGRQQALCLRNLGYEVWFGTDSAVSGLFSGVDMVLLGADKVYPDSFVNKTGSYAICLLASEQGIPVYVLADTRKFVMGDEGTIPEDVNLSGGPPEEVWDAAPEGIKVFNAYFEEIPAHLVTAFVTEEHFIPGAALEYHERFAD